MDLADENRPRDGYTFRDRPMLQVENILLVTCSVIVQTRKARGFAARARIPCCSIVVDANFC